MANLNVINTKLEVCRGDDVSFPVTFTDSNGLPLNITGWKIYFTVKLSYDDNATDSSASIAKDITVHTDPLNGKSSVDLSNLDTNISPGKYIYDIQVKDAQAKIITAVKGTFEVLPDVTRRIS